MYKLSNIRVRECNSSPSVFCRPVWQVSWAASTVARAAATALGSFYSRSSHLQFQFLQRGDYCRGDGAADAGAVLGSLSQMRFSYMYIVILKRKNLLSIAHVTQIILNTIINRISVINPNNPENPNKPLITLINPNNLNNRNNPNKLHLASRVKVFSF